MPFPQQRLFSFVLSIAGTILTGMACFYVFHASETVAALLLMLWTLLVGTFSKRQEAVVASFVAALCLDYWFVLPIFTISVAEPSEWISLLVFLSASLLASHLSAKLRRQRDELAERQSDAERLHALSRALLLNGRNEDARRILVNKCMELFQFSAAVLYESATGEYWRSSSEGTIVLDDLRRVAHYSVAESLNESTHLLPVLLGHKCFGSLGYCGKQLSLSAANSLSNTLATGLAQARAQEASSQAEAVRRSEELKSVMIDALAHDLKTPLTTIEIAADTLIHGELMPADERSGLVREIWQAAQSLRQLIHGAIHLARIEAKRLHLELRPTSVDELVRSAIQSVSDRASHILIMEIAAELPPVLTDSELTCQALKQLVDNALKYSAPGSKVVISAGQMDDQIWISVRDQGTGITELEQSRIFEKFYRGRHEGSALQGTGMGLAIAKEIAEAHGGTISVQSQVGQGSMFTLTLRAALVEQPA